MDPIVKESHKPAYLKQEFTNKVINIVINIVIIKSQAKHN